MSIRSFIASVDRLRALTLPKRRGARRRVRLWVAPQALPVIVRGRHR